MAAPCEEAEELAEEISSLEIENVGEMRKRARQLLAALEAPDKALLEALEWIASLE